MFQSEKLSFPLLNLVRLPDITIDAKTKKKFGVDQTANNAEFLRQISQSALTKFTKNFAPDQQKIYQDRLDFELALVEELCFTDYFLLVWKVINKMIDMQAFRDMGRGSCAGSLVFYVLGVTGVDPIRYNLLFARFISKVRAKKQVIDGVTYLQGDLAPDVDLNLGGARDEIITWLNKEYEGRVCPISTFGTLTGKVLIKEVYKTLEDVPEQEANRVSNLVDKHFGIVEDIEKMPEKNKDFKEWSESHARTYAVALQLRDLIKNKGSHASGYFIAYDLLAEHYPLDLNKEKEPILTFEMKVAAKLGIKLDCLGLTTNQIIQEVLEGTPETMEDLMPKLHADPLIYDQYQHGTLLPYGLYQISADCAYGALLKIKPKDLNELSDLNALARPGALAYLDGYVKGDNPCPHPAFKQILAPTRNYCLYQEQMIQMAVQLGFTQDEGEELRRCVTGDTMFISKQRGYVSINELLSTGYKNEDFLVMDETGRQQWKKITNIWSNGYKQVRHVKTRNGMVVKASRWHQFLTDSGWKARNYLKEHDDYLVCANSISYDGIDKISLEMGIVIAGLVTEGYFVDDRSATFVNHDAEIMNRFTSCFYKEFGADTLNLNNKNIAVLRKVEKDKIRVHLEQGLSASKHLPSVMMGLTKETTAKVLSFIFACEGTVTQTELSLTSKSEKFILQLQLLLLRFGIRSNIVDKNNPEYGKFYVLDIGEFDSVVRFNNELTSELQVYKKEKLQAYVNRNLTQNNTTNIIPARLLEKFRNQYGYLFSYECGRCYTNNMRKDKFVRFANESKDPYWMDLASGQQEYTRVESLKNMIREVEVFDFTIDEETPFIIANGLVIHNCVGKKKVDEVKLWKEKVYNTCEKNGFSKEIGDLFWKILDDSSKYSFNLSHAAATASLSALTTYLKYKYPIQFYTACLNNIHNFPNPMEHLSDIFREVEFFGIKIVPPSISNPEIKFTYNTKNEILMPISSIKGISKKAIDKLRRFKVTDANKIEIFKAAEDAEIPRNIFSSIVLAGSMDKFLNGGSRSKLLLEFVLYKKLTDKEKNFAAGIFTQCNNSIFDCVKYMNETAKDEKGKPIMKDSRRETLKAYIIPHWQMFKQNEKHVDLAYYFFEKELLGFAYTKTLMDIYGPNVPDLTDIRAAKNSGDKEYCRIIGNVIETKRATSKKGTDYLKVVIGDEKESITCMMFNTAKNRTIDNCQETNGRLPEEKDIVICSGQKNGDAVFLDTCGIQDVSVWLKVSQIKET
jgi:DNA polymerase-3 subunit alpha